MRHRIVRHRLGRWVDPASAFAALHRDSPQAFWLDSGIEASEGVSYIGASATWVTASVADGAVTEHPSAISVPGTIFDFLRSRVRVAPGSDGLPLGWVGWFGYELRAQTMAAPGGTAGAVRQSRHSDAALLDVDRIIAFDHARGTVELIAIGARWTPEIAGWRDETERRLAAIGPDGDIRTAVSTRVGEARVGEARAGEPTLGEPPVARWRNGDDAYAKQIEACQAAIRDGEAYQLCLTSEASVATHPHPLDAYLAVRSTSPTHHGGFVRVDDVTLISASPEQFLTVRDGVVESRPIKGTRPRGETPADDRRLLHELESSGKERAENLMIVDLMRNDIGRVAEVGSVTVPTLLAVETYAHVHQLVSTVRGRLATGKHPVDAIVACFPAGSMTGAPKSRAVEVLDHLEQRARGIYSGAFGYVGIDGTVDLAMVIRSIVLDADGATIGAGGGITALSDPVEEIAEVRLKAAALLRALGAVPPTSV